jgi:ribose 5-phosphate isomerase B
MKPIAIASDHAGFALKQFIIESFAGEMDFIDLGTEDTNSCSYADYGFKMADAIKNGVAEQGILICGTGIGISIAANRHKHIRCALCTDSTMAKLTRLHNDANILALGERVIGRATAIDIVKTFFSTEFEGGRHSARVAQLSA